MEEKWQLFLPEKHRATILIALHGDYAYLGTERTFHLVRDKIHGPTREER